MNGPVSPADLARRAGSGADDDTCNAAEAALTQLQQAVERFVSGGSSDGGNPGEAAESAGAVDAAGSGGAGDISDAVGTDRDEAGVGAAGVDAADIVRHATSVDAALQKRLEGTGA